MSASAAASISAVSISKSHSSNASVLTQTKQPSLHRLLLDEKRKSRFLPEIEISRIGGRNSSVRQRRGLEITAKTAGASKNIEVEVDKPLGLTLGQKSGGGVVITAVDSGGNAAKAGLRPGDQVLYTSSFFGDELWPADKLGFTKTAIQAKPDSVYFVVSRGAEVDVKRLPKRPAPPRFGRTLTESQKIRATHICLDCGFIYTLQKPFDEQAVDSGGNAAKAGLRPGDQVLYTSSFFGDELWPADKLGFTKTAIQAKPDSVYFVVSRGAEVDVKRLPKRPAPPRFGRTLTESQKIRATHICLDCGFIYTLQKPFDEQPDSYVCPQCRAPKKRFAGYDVTSGKPIGGGLPPLGVIFGLVLGVTGVGALLVYGLQ